MSATEYVGNWCEGHIKSFNATKGYGFIQCDIFPDDVFVSFKTAPQLRDRATYLVELTGQPVQFLLAASKSDSEKYEARDVELVDESGADGPQAEQRIKGNVKSFSVQQGWGFLTCTQIPDDIFVNFKLAPGLRHASEVLGELRGKPVSFVLQESVSKPGSYEAKDVKVLYDDPSVARGAKGMNKGMATWKGMGKSKDMVMGKGKAKGYGPMGQWCQGWFKSFSTESGWGFLTCAGFPEDIFVSYKTAPNLRACAAELGGALKGHPAQLLLQESQSKPGSYEAGDVCLIWVPPMGPAGDAWGWGKGAMHAGPAQGVKRRMGEAPIEQGSRAAALAKRLKGGGKEDESFNGSGAADFVDTTVSGQIKSFSQDSRWGFVNSESFGEDCFFNLRSNPHLDGVPVKAGQRITFIVRMSKSREGAFEAEDISLASGGNAGYKGGKAPGKG